MRLQIHEKAYDRNRAALDALAGQLELVLLGDDGRLTVGGAEIDAETAQPDIVLANADAFFSPSAPLFMTAALKSRALKWVQSGAAGVDHAIFGQFVQKGAKLTTSHGQSVGMADYVLWGVLDALQDGPGRRAAQAAGQWKRLVFREVDGSRWVVVGFGAIGQGVGRRARAFGAHVTGVRRHAAPDPNADAMATPDQLPTLLAQADVVVLAAPATPQTQHMADAGFFAALKPGAIFVNVGRGALVDEPALLAALESGAVGHAVLDVFEVEPLPAESPFWAHPRVTITPHSSGMSVGNAARNDALFLENLRRYLAGEPLANEAAPQDVLAGK
jgi:phosphoglycerate dehydrogenase-like enzyme